MEVRYLIRQITRLARQKYSSLLLGDSFVTLYKACNMVRHTFFLSPKSIIFCIPGLLSLISTHAFSSSPAKFFAWNMRRVVKRTEQDEKFFFAVGIPTSAKFSCSETNQICYVSHVDILRGSKNFHKMAAPKLCQA